MYEYYKVDEFSKIFKLSPVTVRRWCKSGKIKAKKLGKSWYIPRDELVLFKELVKANDSPSDSPSDKEV